MRDILAVGIGSHRRGIDEDDVHLLSRRLQKLFHLLALQQLLRAFALVICKNRIDPVAVVFNERILELGPARKNVGQCYRVPVLILQNLLQSRLAHVAVDQEHLFLLLPHGNGKICGHSRLALIFEHGSDHDDLRARAAHLVFHA